MLFRSGRVCRDICKLYLEPSNADRDLPSILHFSSEEGMTKWQMVKSLAEIMGLPLDGMEPFCPSDNSPVGTQRPYDCHLDTSVLKDLGVDVDIADFRTWW